MSYVKQWTSPQRNIRHRLPYSSREGFKQKYSGANATPTERINIHADLLEKHERQLRLQPWCWCGWGFVTTIIVIAVVIAWICLIIYKNETKSNTCAIESIEDTGLICNGTAEQDGPCFINGTFVFPGSIETSSLVVTESVLLPRIKVVFVEIDGNDTNDGTRENPVETIQRALEIVSFHFISKIFIGNGTFNLGDLPNDTRPEEFIVTGTQIIGTEESLFNTTILSKSLLADYEYTTTFTTPGGMTPGEFEGKYLRVQHGILGTFANAPIRNNTNDSITVVGKFGFFGAIDASGGPLEIFSLSTVITWDSGFLVLAGITTNFFNSLVIDMGGPVVGGTGGGTVNLNTIDFLGNELYSLQTIQTGELTLESCRLVDVTVIKSLTSGVLRFNRVHITRTPGNLNGTRIDLSDSTIHTSQGGFILESDQLHTLTDCIFDIGCAGIFGDNGLLIVGGRGDISNFKVVGENRTLLQLERSADVELHGTICLTSDGGAESPVISIRTSSVLTIGGEGITIITTNPALSATVNMTGSTFNLHTVFIHVGESRDCIFTEGGHMTFVGATLFLNDSIGGRSRLRTRTTMIRMINSFIFMNNTLGNQPQISWAGAHITLVNTEIIVRTDRLALNIEDGAIVTVQFDSKVSLTSTTGPSILIRRSGKLILDQRGVGNFFSIVAATRCISLGENSQLIVANLGFLDFDCGTTEISMSGLSTTVIHRDATVILQAGTVDKSDVGSVTFNTSELLGTPGKSYSDGLAGAGVQLCAFVLQ